MNGAEGTEAAAGTGAEDMGGGLVADAMKAAEGAGQQKPEGQQAGQQAQTVSRPDGVPEKFWDDKAGTVRTDALVKAYADAERALHEKSNRSKDDPAPKDAADYWKDYKVPDALAKDVVLNTDDPLMQALGTWAHKHGIGKGALLELVNGGGDMPGALKIVADALPKPVDVKAELAKLGPDAQQITGTVGTWLAGMRRDGVLSMEEVRWLAEVGSDAFGARVLAKVRSSMLGTPMPLIAVPEGGGSREDYYARHRDPRYASDERFRRETEEMGARLFGGGVASGA